MSDRALMQQLKRALLCLYVAIVITAFLVERTFWTPDIIFLVLLGLFVILGEGKRFLLYFLPFVVLLLSYEKLRSLAPLLNSHVHYTAMITIDRFMFGGHLPTTSLQHLLYHGHVQWYDFILYFFYMLHFVTPLLFAVVLWRYKTKYYWQYVTALLLLSYIGFITYVAFPAAPPWLAAEGGILPNVSHISTNIWFAMGVKNFSDYYKQLSPNLVAAMPSLHAAYPFLLALMVRKVWGNRWFLIAMLYPLIIWFAVVYLGEHYVIDVIIGLIYALLSYLSAPYVIKFATLGWKKLNHKRTITMHNLQR